VKREAVGWSVAVDGLVVSMSRCVNRLKSTTLASVSPVYNNQPISQRVRSSEAFSERTR